MYTRYVARRRAKFGGIDGEVNIPYGTVLLAQNGFLMHRTQRVCAVGSQNALDYFSQDDDGRGLERGRLVGDITAALARRDAQHQNRWDKVWDSALCQKYRRASSENHWLWAKAFYDAPVCDLLAIAALLR